MGLFLWVVANDLDIWVVRINGVRFDPNDVARNLNGLFPVYFD